MRPVKHIAFCIICLYFVSNACAQNKNKVPASVHDIFNDLPINDPSKNSILQPGEDSIKKIRENIFVTSVISKRHCFLGEPVLLTVSLYSALQSTSKIAKAPSFAGFGVD